MKSWWITGLHPPSLNILESKNASYLWWFAISSIHLGARIAIEPRPSPSAAIVSSSEQWAPPKTVASRWWFATPSCLQVGFLSEHGICKVMEIGGKLRLRFFFEGHDMLVDGIIWFICGICVDVYLIVLVGRLVAGLGWFIWSHSMLNKLIAGLGPEEYKLDPSWIYDNNFRKRSACPLWKKMKDIKGRSLTDMTTHSPAGMAHMAGLIEGGMSHRDAVAQVAQWKMSQGFGWLTRLVSQFHPQDAASDPSVHLCLCVWINLSVWL